MDLFTIILDFYGGTYIEQIESDTPRMAAINWALKLETKNIHGLGSSSKKKIITEIKNINNSPILVNDTTNTWCTSFSTRGKLGLINIIKTKKT